MSSSSAPNPASSANVKEAEQQPPQLSQDDEVEIDEASFLELKQMAEYRAGRQLTWTGGGGDNDDDGLLGGYNALTLASNTQYNAGGAPASYLYGGGFAGYPQTPVINIQQQAEEEGEEEGDEIDLPDEEPELIMERWVEEVSGLGLDWELPFTRFSMPNNRLIIKDNMLYNICKGGYEGAPCFILGRLAMTDLMSKGEWVFDDVYWTFISDKLVALLDSPKAEFEQVLEEFRRENAEQRSHIEKRRAIYEKEQAELDALAAAQHLSATSLKTPEEEINADALAAESSSTKRVRFAN